MQANDGKVNHYADALIAIAKASDALHTMENDFVHLLQFMKENEALQRFLASMTVAKPGKRRALREILKGQVHPMLIDFVTMLLTSGDLALLPQVADAFFEKASEVHERVAGEIHVASPLEDHRVAAIEAEVGRILNKKVNLRPRVMPGILGGALVKIGDFIIDGTIERQLEETKRQLLA
jgi:F-type H+-transporting ATPase subunit delta